MDAGARVERVNNLSPLSTIAAAQHESTNGEMAQMARVFKLPR